MVIKLLGIDPGKTTGYARLDIDEDKQLKLGLFGITKDMTLVDIKKHVEEADIIIYEGWWTRPDKARGGAFDYKSMHAPEVIGSLLTLCKLLQKERIVKQQPSQRVPGYGFVGLVYKAGARGTHWQDALAHAGYYAVTKLQALPVRKK